MTKYIGCNICLIFLYTACSRHIPSNKHSRTETHFSRTNIHAKKHTSLDQILSHKNTLLSNKYRTKTHFSRPNIIAQKHTSLEQISHKNTLLSNKYYRTKTHFSRTNIIAQKHTSLEHLLSHKNTLLSNKHSRTGTQEGSYILDLLIISELNYISIYQQICQNSLIRNSMDMCLAVLKILQLYRQG